eukprot:IDg7840t1
MATVDGTDIEISEPQHFHRKWFSHKILTARLRCEVAVSLAEEIVSVNRPYPCGSPTEVRIFREHLKLVLLPGGMVRADKGYTDELCVTPLSLPPTERRRATIIRDRNETQNCRMKISWCYLRV